jgi:hypothetical protein
MAGAVLDDPADASTRSADALVVVVKSGDVRTDPYRAAA